MPTSTTKFDILEIRGIAVIILFALTFYLLHLIATVPSLASNELFKTVVILLLGNGGLGIAISYIFGGSKATTGAIETVNAMAMKSTPDVSSAPKTEPVVVQAPASVTITPDSEPKDSPNVDSKPADETRVP